MSHPDCAFAYSQARLQARLGQRPTAADWQRLHATRDLAALLQVAENTSLAPWTLALPTSASAHEAERRLRARWLRCVDEVAAWQPERWRAAIGWLRWLPYLPALEKLARAGKPLHWMRDDPLLGPIVAEDPRLRAASVRRTELAPLASGFGTPSDVTGAWLRHWRGLWPKGPASRPLERLWQHVLALRDELAAAADATPSTSALARLERRLLVAFRRNPLSPVAAVTYLGMAGLDLAQLRGAVAVRSLRAVRGPDA